MSIFADFSWGGGGVGISITKKLVSDRGASLSMALMLFLVCTVVSSIVIVAGSAAAGRLSQLREMEKSYYNVTSAAKLLTEELDGTASGRNLEVTVVRSKNADTWSVSIDGKRGPFTSANSTLFEILTGDLIFFSDGVHTSNSSLTDKINRNIGSDQVKATFDTSETPPQPNDVEFVPCAYEAFEVTPSGEIDGQYTPVMVTVKRNDDDTFSFTFTEEVSDSNPSPAVYTVVANVQVGYPEYNNSETSPSWTNTVTWGYLYTIAGDA